MTSEGPQRFLERVDSSSSIGFFLLIWVPVLIVYVATASWFVVSSTDPFTNMATAWKLGTDGTIYLDEHENLLPYRGVGALIVEAENGRPVSQYPPGAALLAAPLYSIWPTDARVIEPGSPELEGSYLEHADIPILVPPLAPGALVGAVTTSLAVALAALTARRFTAPRIAILGAAIYGFGTGAWAVAADDLWQHGPAMLWIALGVFSISRSRDALGGLAFGAAIFTRPVVTLIAAVVGLMVGIKDRDPRRVILIGIGSIVGLSSVIGFNWVVFGELSVSGGYSADFADRATSGGLGWYLGNVAKGLFHPAYGLLVLSPVLAIAATGLVADRKRLPSLGIATLVASTVYLLIHWKLNRASGGSGFLGYRYPLEAIAACAPFLIVGWEWIRERHLWVRALLITSAYSVGVYAITALVLLSDSF